MDGQSRYTASEGGLAARALWLGRARIFLVWATCALLYLTMPGSPDQYEFDYLGWRILEGDVPYRDFVDMNWPLNMFLHAIGVALFGNQLWSWHAVDFALIAAAALVASRWVDELAGGRARTIFLLVYPILYVALPFWFVGQPDMTGGHLLVLGAYFHTRAHQQHRLGLQVVAGLFYGAAISAKPTLAIAPLLLSLAPLALGAPMKKVALHCLVAFTGTIAAVCLGFSLVLLCGTSVQELLDATIVYNTQTQFAHTVPWPKLGTSLFKAYRESWLIGVVLAIVGLLRNAQTRSNGLLLSSFVALWVAATISFFVQRQGFLYHTASMTLPVVALMTVGAVELVSLGKKRGARWAVPILPFVLLVGPALPRILNNYGTLALAAIEGDLSPHQMYFYAGDGLSVYQAKNIAKVLKSEVDPTDSVLYVGTNSATLFLAERRNATRFYYMPVLERLSASTLTTKWISWLQQDLATRPHDYVIVRSAGVDGWISQLDVYPAAKILKPHLQDSRLLTDKKWTQYPSLRVYERRDHHLN